MLTDACTGMNIDPRLAVGVLRHNPWNIWDVHQRQFVSYTVNGDCIKSGISEDNLCSVPSCRISIKGCIYIRIEILSDLWNLGEKIEADVLSYFLAFSSIDIPETLVIYKNNLKLLTQIVHYVLNENSNPVLGGVCAINFISVKARIYYHNQLLQYIYNHVLIRLSEESHLVNSPVVVVIRQNAAHYAVDLVCWLVVLAIHSSCLSI